ncbi:hypothetical protein [Brevundimonas naejangsanensis]|uniref:hypothetical protein n=1 Tax=Brevundimonas naejangsanensis TaxID=588932 RepID=UPI0026EB4506|nr:hypothetical protein [Brevundimonas naejangsanensis]
MSRALTIKMLSAKLDALASPDAQVFFCDDLGEIHAIGGGLLDVDSDTQLPVLLLSAEPVVTEGGF